MELASSLASSFRLPELQLPELSWPSGTSASSTSGAAASSESGLLPMPVSFSTGMARVASFATGGAVDADEIGEADWSIAGSPCPLCASLGWKERLIGFVASLALGGLLTSAAFFSWSALFLGRPEKFAIMYTLGNVCNICSTLFLVGPASQCRRMWVKSRRLATIAYLSCLVLMLLCTWIRWRDFGMSALGAVLTFTFVGIQSAALLWYGLSYVPFGRSAFTQSLQGLRDWFFG